MAPFLRSLTFNDPLRLLYRGTLRVLLILLHDFPEFLCSYHFSFMDVIPHQCVQLRNLVLSAFPVGMKLPDPFTPNVNSNLLTESRNGPLILSDFTTSLAAGNLKHDLDVYLKTRTPLTFIHNLKTRLLLERPDATGRYNFQIINSLVLYAGVYGISQTPVGAVPTFVSSSSTIDIFHQLVTDLDNEGLISLILGRYFFLCAIANHLRYPNSHTHFFSLLMLHLFSEAKQEIIQEQITRVLLERLIVNRPHPHGLLVTFIELIRNQKYNFWEHTKFIRCSPEIEKLFSSVAKSINMG